MNPDKQLLVGIVMMSIGGLVALLAFTILREQQKAARKKAKEKLKLDPLESDNDAPATAQNSDEAEDIQQSNIQERIHLIFRKLMNWIRSKTPDEETLEPQEEVTKAAEAVAPIPTKAQPKRKRISVFTLLRDEEKGNLIVQVGDHEYHSSQDLHDSPDWSRVEYATADLSVWLSSAQEQDTEEMSVQIQESKALSMVDQINQFLQRNLSELKNEQRRIKLYEGPDETVRVLIENNSYAIEEVPDPKVSKLIREAVSEWEALQ